MGTGAANVLIDVVAAGSVALAAVVAMLNFGKTVPSRVLLVVLFLCVGLLGLAFSKLSRSQRRRPFALVPGAEGMVVGGLSLILSPRIPALFGRFGGDPLAINFGDKCRWADSGEPQSGVGYANGLACIGKGSNAAFEPRTIIENSAHFGHGLLSITLFGVMEANFPARILYDGLGLWGALYPVYNIVKRASRASWGTFAISSYCNNGAEWALGFLLGLCYGTYAWADTNTDNDQEEAPSPNTYEDYYESVMGRLRQLIGAALILSCFLASVLFGLSWDADRAREGKFHWPAFIGLAALPVMGVLLTAYLAAIRPEFRRELIKPRRRISSGGLPASEINKAREAVRKARKREATVK